MRKILLLLLCISGLAFAQMPNIQKVWLNRGNYYSGTISKEKIPMKVVFQISEQDKKNDQEYFVSGFSVVKKSMVRFEGKIKISKYKDRKKQSAVYGEYELVEEAKGKHSGTFKGKFIYTFDWNKNKEIVENEFLEFIGDWQSYDGTMIHKTMWTNQLSK